MTVGGALTNRSGCRSRFAERLDRADQRPAHEHPNRRRANLLGVDQLLRHELTEWRHVNRGVARSIDGQPDPGWYEFTERKRKRHEPSSSQWNTVTATSGAHVLKAIAYDVAGNTATVTVGVTVDNSPPMVTLTAPVAIGTGKSYALLAKAYDAAGNNRSSATVTVISR